MGTYLQVFTVTIKEYFVYRLNFILWRLRKVINLMVIFFLWYAVFDHAKQFGTYQKADFLSYILYANLISNFVLGTRATDIASDINDGKIINILLKPVSFFRYYFTRDLTDKCVNLFFALFEILLIVLIFKSPIVPPQSILLFVLLLINGTLIAYFISLLLSFVAFWTTETWGPQFLFYTLLFFLSGSFFPLDVLPPAIYKALLLTPFPYLYYLPTSVLIGKTVLLSPFEIAMSFIWVIGFWMVVKYVWNKGTKSFSFWGK